jgi:acid phosphatase
MKKLFRCLKFDRIQEAFLVVAVVALLSPLPLMAQGTLPRPTHIVIVIEENHSFGEIVGESEVPYINSLIKDGALLTRFFSNHHPSQPNYFVLFSGDRQKIINDDCFENSPQITNQSLGGQLLTNGRTFKGYAEDLPATGSKTCGTGRYRRKHAPWVSFADIPPTMSLPFNEFPTDFDKLPTVAFVIPNMADDMHDGIFGVRRKKGDKWLRNNLQNYVEWAKTHNSLLILTWDEDDKLEWFAGETTKPPANHIATILVGEMVKPGTTSDKQYTHLDLLRTLQEMYGLPPLTGTQNASVITDIWK